MKITASVAVSSDGYMDDTSPKRLVLSDDADWLEVHTLRSECDAILVGAETLRRDNPSLVLREQELRAKRIAHGKSPDIVKIVVSGSGNLSSDLRFFTEGETAPKIVITTPMASDETILRLSESATVIIQPEITAHDIAASLTREGIESLLIEGGAHILKMFMDEDMVDQMRLAVSPIVVTEEQAPRLPYFGTLPFECRAEKTIRQVGRMTIHDYIIHHSISAEDKRHLMRAVELSRLSPPCDTAYRVGCVLKTSDGKTHEGYTHETGPHNHAEEEAIAKAIADGADLSKAAIYTSMEPCSTRSSKPISCSELIIRHGISKVFYAYKEPDCFVRCEATERLRNAGIEVFAVPELSTEVIEINSHIIGRV